MKTIRSSRKLSLHHAAHFPAIALFILFLPIFGHLAALHKTGKPVRIAGGTRHVADMAGRQVALPKQVNRIVTSVPFPCSTASSSR